MSLKVIFLIAVPMFVICCAILLKYWDRFKKPPKQRGHRKIEKVPETVLTIEKVPETVITICSDKMSSDNQNEAEEKMAKAIFISADCWLCVFDLLPPRQLGFGISMISHRFNFYVDEHFKTRKWTLAFIGIQSQNGENGSKKMQIVNCHGKALPIPLNPLPNKIIGFRRIQIIYIDQNVIAFLRRFHRFFAVCSTDLEITMGNDRILDFVLLNILPMFRNSIDVMFLNTIAFRRMRQLAPSLLNECPSLRAVLFDDDILPAFPPDESANATDGQAVAKWLFTPSPDSVPKWFKCLVNSSVDQWSSTIEQLKTGFSNASSPITFRIFLRFSSNLIGSIVQFELINEVTVEKLTLEHYENYFLLTRCPIGWDDRKWLNSS